ncbi:MAG: phenylalanine--tRNA ligase subunit beta [Clostridia bacterium]
MKAPLSWLKEYTDIPVGIREYADAMTMSGSKVESIGELGQDITRAVVGKVLDIRRHPGADKLLLAQVDVGSKVIQVVTGAKNVARGDMVPVVLDGGTLAGGTVIRKGNLRGEISEGMMCSLEELGLNGSDYPHAVEDGILVLQTDVPAGTDVKALLGLDEAVVEFEITPNRPDCFSIIGLARESAAALGTSFGTGHAVMQDDQEKDVPEDVSVLIEDGDLCSRYSAKIITGVRIEPSPEWMRKRLRNAGVRPINNIVDITNYLMLEYGQPMHAFDLERIAGKSILVRRAKEGECITTLDGQERELDASMLVIADAKKPVAVAGVMGGSESEIDSHTRTILFESAHFNPLSVRLSAKKLGMRTESSSRFEKGLDVCNTVPALIRACELVERLGAGKVEGGIIDEHGPLPDKKTLLLDPQRINALLGTEIPTEEMVEILEKLEFRVDKDMAVEVPSFRGDVVSSADLSEEVARFYGYNKIKATLLSGKQSTMGLKTEKQMLRDRVHQVMVSCGLHEIYTYSFTSPKVFDKLNLDKSDPLREALPILNPLGEDYSIMRTTTLPEMLGVIAHNHNRRAEECSFYEISHTFHPKGVDTLPVEKSILTVGMVPGDFFRLKGILEELFEAMGICEDWKKERENRMYHPGRCALITYEGREMGIAGQIHPEVAKSFEVPESTYVAAISLDLVYECSRIRKTYEPLPRYPAVARDIALVIDEETESGAVEGLIREHGGGFIESVRLFDVYRGENVQKDKKSVAYSIVFRSRDKTLTDIEVNQAMGDIMHAVREKLGGELR